MKETKELMKLDEKNYFKNIKKSIKERKTLMT